MSDRSLRADARAAARRATGQPEPGLRDQIAEAVRRHYIDTRPDVADADGNLPCSCAGWREGGDSDEDSWDAHMAEVAAAVVQPQFDAKQAEADGLRGFIERGFDTHMQFGVIEPDGTTTMLPCADWCYACKLEKAEGERDALRAIARSTAVSLRDTAERVEQGRTVNTASLRAQAKAIDEIAGGQP